MCNESRVYYSLSVYVRTKLNVRRIIAYLYFRGRGRGRGLMHSYDFAICKYFGKK
jgi:hypothetical protein